MTPARPPRLPRPAADEFDSSFWIDEAIWGHRLYDEQVPWLVLLEFLSVFQSEEAKGRGLLEQRQNRLIYQAYRRLHLRNIVFNNPWMPWVLSQTPDDGERWKLWLDRMAENAIGLTGTGARDFSYLRQRFESFEDLANLVGLIRSTSIEGDSNKRWSSKFVFPYGPSCLYEDVRVGDRGELSNDRRFFARSGELVYLMLARSNKNHELRERFSKLLLNPASPWNRLVNRLQPAEEPVREPNDQQRSCFLPYAAHPDFDAFGQDLTVLFDTELPGYDVLPHIVDIVGLHLVLYVLRRAAEWVPGEPRPVMVLEIIAPKRTTVRDLSIETYERNNRLSARAIGAFIKEEVELSADWQRACTSSDPFGEAAAVVYAKTAWKAAHEQGKKFDGPRDPQTLLKQLYEQAAKRHSQHMASVHGSYTHTVGLASRRNTRRYRYAPSDHFLKSLVLCVVPLRMEFQRFLQVLYERYGLIIGHHQAEGFIKAGSSDQRAFEENARRLEMRLGSLGLLRRLSDACAYVVNPWVEQT